MEVKDNHNDFFNLSLSFTINFKATPQHDIDRAIKFLDYHQFIYKKYPKEIVIFNTKK